MAGLNYDCANTRHGLELSVAGYSHKLPVLLSKVAEALASPATLAGPESEAVWARLHDKLTKQLENFYFQQPYQHCM